MTEEGDPRHSVESGHTSNFRGDGVIHDVVIDRMFDILNRTYQPIWISRLVNSWRKHEPLQSDDVFAGWIAEIGEGAWIVATHCGTVKQPVGRCFAEPGIHRPDV
jgi:hypothetical protein